MAHGVIHPLSDNTSKALLRILLMATVFLTAWLALSAWSISLLGRAGYWPFASTARLLWTVGCVANLAHIGLAMHIVHGWSHADAVAEVARRTYDQVGIAWGGGIYFNYALATLWLLDAGYWWLTPRSYETRPRWIEGLIQFYFLFMFFNATVVFGLSLTTRIAGIAGTAIACLALPRILRTR